MAKKMTQNSVGGADTCVESREQGRERLRASKLPRSPMSEDGIFANALRFLSLSAAAGVVPGSVHKRGMSTAAAAGAEEDESGGAEGAAAAEAAAEAEVNPVLSAYVRGSVRAAGLAWEGLEGAAVLPSRLARAQRLLEGPSRVVDLEALRAACWSGMPCRYRIASWQMLLGYLPLQRDRQRDTLARRKEEYRKEEAQRRGGAYVGRNEVEQALLRQVLVDVPRTCPEIAVFHCDWMQRSLERVLSTFATRHPAMSYVQGLNDLATPFYAVFLAPWLDPWAARDVAGAVEPGALQDIEADVYWCFTKLLEGIQDHYTPSQPGIQRMIHAMRELVHRIDGARARSGSSGGRRRPIFLTPSPPSSTFSPRAQSPSCGTSRAMASSSRPLPSAG